MSIEARTDEAEDTEETMRRRYYSKLQSAAALLALAAACSPFAREDRPRASPAVHPWYPTNPSLTAAALRPARIALGPNLGKPAGQLAGSLDDAPAVAPRLYAARAFPLGGTIANAAINPNLGHALDEWLSHKTPAEVMQYGVSLLTPAQLFGTGDNNNTHGLCENIELQWNFREDDGSGTLQNYQGDVALWGYSYFTQPIVPFTWKFSEQTACRDALLAAHGDAEAAIAGDMCNRGHLLSFFRDGSDCRACVEGAMGDFASCVTMNRCADEGQIVESVNYASGETVWFDVFSTFIAACAPGYTIRALLFANEKEDETVPDPFDHASWAHLCAPYWSESAGAPQWSCSGATLPTLYDGEVMTEGVLGPTRYLRASGTSAETWSERRYFVREIDLANGLSIRYGWAGNPGTGVMSAPPSHRDTNGDGSVGPGDENWGQQYIGYGLHPFALRPDGHDANNLDDTFARDWLAATTLKTSTHVNGVPVMFYNHNRCETWQGPDADGAWRCTKMHAPDAGWLNDGVNWWYDAEHVRAYVHATATIASTGLFDPLVPGGIVVAVAASATFADPNFENCGGYPASFVPDLEPLPDIPDAYSDDAQSMTGETYKFGKNASDPDFRVVLNTNWVRHHCPTDGD